MRILTRLNGMLTILNNVAWFSVSDDEKFIVIVDNDDDMYYITATEDYELNLNDWMYDALRDGYVDFSHEKYFSELIKDADLEDDELDNSQLYFEQLKVEQEADDE